jgi:hypothetical protein
MEDLINKYFEKSLTTKELEDFHQKLNLDAEFKTEFEFQKSVQSAIKSKERAEIKNLIAGFEKPQKRNFWWKYAVAAIVVIVGGGVILQHFLTKNSSSELYLSYYQTYPNVIAPNVRGESEDNLKTKAFAAYDAGDFQTASQLFGELKTQINEDYAVFYEGVSNLEINKPDKTIALFENKKFRGSTNSLEDYRQWYLALAYLKTGNNENAKKILSEISKTKNPQKTKAVEILSKL